MVRAVAIFPVFFSIVSLAQSVKVPGIAQIALAGAAAGARIGYGDTAPLNSPVPANVPLAAGQALQVDASGSIGQGSGSSAITPNGALSTDYTNTEVGIGRVDGTSGSLSDVLVIYATGLGAVSPKVPSGVPAPTDPLSRLTVAGSVIFGGVPATPQFAGLAPTLVGVFQINVTVPPGVPAGNSILRLSVVGSASNDVPISVQAQ
jgi:hypothetical protein